tara:strand:+ start:360 stop:917 length:558 start_codon:yes stop_codon:yes gene_type:complete
MTTKTKRHSSNPFIKDMVIPIGSKSIQIMPLGQNNNVLVNQVTGEMTGTHVVAHKRVDTEKFIKTFADYMAFTFDLTRAGNKALKIVMWQMQQGMPNKDQVILDKYTWQDFIDAHKKLDPPLNVSYPTFSRGLAELEQAKIIAKHMRAGTYYINPQCIFSGDRIAFTTVLERNGQAEAKEVENKN